MSAKIKVEKKANPINEPAENLTGRSFRDENDESKNREIETSLSEIYRDSSGNKIDVNRMKIRRKQGLIFWFFNLLVFALVVIVIGLGGYYYFFYGKGTDATALALNIDSPAAVSANQEFTYTIDYKNQEYVAIKSATLEVDYPANFVYLGATPAPDSNNNSWNVGRLNARSDGKIVIRGKIIDQVNATAVMLARMIYTPENFSSEFKKENSVSTLVKDIGFDTTFDYQATALVNDPENLTLTFKPLSQNFFSEFTLNLATDNNIEIGEASALTSPGENSSSSLSVKKIANSQQNAWRISGLDGQDESLVIKYRVKEKTTDTENIKITLSATSSTAEGEKSFVFLEKNLSLEVMKSDLNLNLILNGSSEGQPVDFGQKLNYSITYANKGETSMNNVVIMAVLDSDFVDWTTLQDENQGREAGNTLTWTKAEIPSLEKVGVGEQGTIDFSVNVLPFKESDLGKDFKITSYAQYTIGGLDNLGGVSTSTASSSTAFDNRSNKIE
ncbi:MAG TPA: hypothetical protein VMD74_05260, partial [Candidatus Methylomirabilis sp.]|nr:hypothetical protein [Candidatus Methylomirabilis sp.]